MAQNTWNFPCWQATDGVFNGVPGFGSSGQVFETGNSQTIDVPYPFVDEFTFAFSFLARSGWTADNGTLQYIMSLGDTDRPWINLYVVMDISGDSKIHYEVYDSVGGATPTTARYVGTVGDEDGTNWLQFDKWYQGVMTFDTSGFDISVNGTASPKQVIATNAPGALDMNASRQPLWLHGGPTSDKGILDQVPGGALPSLVFGPGAMLDGVIDLTSSTVLNRFYDSNGDWKQPGEDGSLWFGDTYGLAAPDSFFMDGSARFSISSTTIPMRWGSNEAAGGKAAPGGLRKQYES